MLRVVCSWFAHIAGRLGRQPKALAAVAAVALIVVGGWMIVTANEVTELEPIGSARSPASESTQDREAFDFLIKYQMWAEGYSSMARRPIPPPGSGQYWAIYRGTSETGSHLDYNNKPMRVLCLHLYAKEIQEDAVGIVTPHPYFLGFMLWPEVRMACARDVRAKHHDNDDLPFEQPYEPATTGR